MTLLELNDAPRRREIATVLIRGRALVALLMVHDGVNSEKAILAEFNEQRLSSDVAREALQEFVDSGLALRDKDGMFKLTPLGQGVYKRLTEKAQSKPR